MPGGMMTDLLQALADLKANVDDFFAWLKSVAGAAAIAGAAGGAVRAMTLKESMGQSAVSVLVGFMAASYLSKPIAEGFMTGFDRESVGFLVGIGGIAIVGFILDLIRKYRAEKAGKRAA